MNARAKSAMDGLVAGPTSGEQAADLAALRAAAEAQPPAPGTPEAAALAMPDQLESMRAGVSACIRGVSMAFAPVCPSLVAIYNDETIAAAAAAIAPVLVKHPAVVEWFGGSFGAWGEEIAAAMVLVPLGLATVQGVRADLAARKPAGAALADGTAARPVVAPDQPAVVGSKAVQFGNVPMAAV